MSDEPIEHLIEDKEGLAFECARLSRENRKLRQQLEAKEEECRQRIKADRLYCLKHGGEAAQSLAAENEALVSLIRDIKAWDVDNLALDIPLEIRQRMQAVLDGATVKCREFVRRNR